MEGNINATLTWTSILSISYLLVMITAPWVGAYADSSGNHKTILYAATLFCSVPTVGLGFCGPETLLLAAILLVISNFSYSVHQDITASYLVTFCKGNQLGRISGFGWAWGFVGGITTLILSLLWIHNASYFLANTTITTQVKVAGAMVITGVIFGVVSLIALLRLKKFKPPYADENWKGAWSRILKSLNRKDESKDLYDFLLCVFVYQSGIATVITIAAIYAKEVMNFSIEQTIVMILIVNFTACVGAFGFGFLQDKIGHKNSLLLSLIFWLLTVALIFFFQIQARFFGLLLILLD
jgi:UMF1 family MFS transporter